VERNLFSVDPLQRHLAGDAVLLATRFLRQENGPPDRLAAGSQYSKTRIAKTQLLRESRGSRTITPCGLKTRVLSTFANSADGLSCDLVPTWCRLSYAPFRGAVSQVLLTLSALLEDVHRAHLHVVSWESSIIAAS